ncbi:MAG: PAS domain S-box protein, partial [Bradyrhizobium sp.]
NLWVKDAESRFVIANRATALRMGYSRSQDLVGKSDRELCPWETAQKFLADERRVIESGRPMIDSEEYVLDANGEKLWIATTKAPLRNEGGDVVGVTGVSRDITRRRLAEALREGQAGIIEMIVGGAPAPDVLAELADLVESQSHGAVASIILVSGEQPRVGEVTQRAIQDRRAALLAGPLQPAIHDGETVIVPDIAADPSWRDHRAFFLKHGVRGCWATPIGSRSGTPLGVLGIFAHSVREPDESELKLMQMAAQLASIAIERAA